MRVLVLPQMQGCSQQFGERFLFVQAWILEESEQQIAFFDQEVAQFVKLAATDGEIEFRFAQRPLRRGEIAIGPVPGYGARFFHVPEAPADSGKTGQKLVADLAVEQPCDHVQILDSCLGLPFRKQRLGAAGDEAEEGAHAGDDQDNRERLAGRGDRMHIAVADRGHGDDAEVNGVHEGPALQVHEGPGARGDDDAQGGQQKAQSDDNRMHALYPTPIEKASDFIEARGIRQLFRIQRRFTAREETTNEPSAA